MRRILVINLLPLLLFGAGILYLDSYRRGLIQSETTALLNEGRIIAGALAEVVIGGDESTQGRIDVPEARELLLRLTHATASRARLFDVDGRMVADSRELLASSGEVQVEEVPPPDVVNRWWARLVRYAMAPLPRLTPLPPYREPRDQRAFDYPEVVAALAGGEASALRDAGRDGDLLTVALPVQRFKKVQGALMLSTTLGRVDGQLRQVRSSILALFGLTLSLTVLLSLYLASTIARPVRRLAEAADLVRLGRGRADTIPDLTDHGDEVGELSAALIDMTATLQERMEATERFAADVAHEIKNPLSSLRSAVEVANRVADGDQRRRLLDVALEDVRRLDRLITDIANASRLDAEMSRAATGRLDIGALLATLAEMHETGAHAGRVRIVLDVHGDLTVRGVEGRLGQLFRNLVDNAVSFSPDGGTIRLTARRRDRWVEVAVDDQGPGLPPNKLEAIFDRFYSQRPQGERFGTHSGLGLSIAKQIVEAHGGSIRGENLGSDPEHSEGARFVVRLPAEGR